MNRPQLPIVLILCTGNSCRSQMAEGILRQAAGDLLDVRSAGSKPVGRVNPLAIRALAEIGIDISGHHSKHMDEFLQQDVETVITVCGNADQACPMFPGQLNRHHWGFDDPPHGQARKPSKASAPSTSARAKPSPSTAPTPSATRARMAESARRLSPET